MFLGEMHWFPRISLTWRTTLRTVITVCVKVPQNCLKVKFCTIVCSGGCVLFIG